MISKKQVPSYIRQVLRRSVCRIMTTFASVYELKSGFISSQVQILGSVPNPCRDWQEVFAKSEHGDLPKCVLTQVYYKRLSESFQPTFLYSSLSCQVNVVARKHQKVVYSAQALRHVAEQIDALYWEQSDGFEGAPPRQEEVLRCGVNLQDIK